MTSIHHDIVFRTNEKRRTNDDGGDRDGEDHAIPNQQVTRGTADATASEYQNALASGQFAFVESETNEDGTRQHHLASTQRSSRRRLLGSNLYSSFRKKSSQVYSRDAVKVEGMAFIPSQISLREGSLISDLHPTSPQSSQSKLQNRKVTQNMMDPRLMNDPDRHHEPVTRPRRRYSLGSMAPEPPKLRELIQDSGILDEITLQKDGSMESILEERLSLSEWRQLSKKTQLAVSSAIESTLQEVLSLENHPSFYSSAKSGSSDSQGMMIRAHSVSNESSSTYGWLSHGDTTLSSQSMDALQSSRHAELQEQGASFEPESESARPLQRLSTNENEREYLVPAYQWEMRQQERQDSPSDAIPTSRSLSISSRYEPSVSPIPDGVELDVMPVEFDNNVLQSHRRVASEDLQTTDFLLSEEEVAQLNRKYSTQSTVSEITMDTNVKTSGRSILSTPPATPMVLDPRAPQLLMAKLQSDPNAEINVFPRPPIALESPTPPMRKRSPDDDQNIAEDLHIRTGNDASNTMRPYARKGTLTHSAREQVLEMGAILENDEKAEANASELRALDHGEVDSDVESESGDLAPMSLRGPFANDSDAARPIQLGGLLKPQRDSNPLLFPAPLMSDDEDDDHFLEGVDPVRPQPVHREPFGAASATPSIDNRRKGLSNVFVAAKEQKAAQHHRDIVFDSSNSSIDIEADTAPLDTGPASSAGQLKLLDAKSTFQYQQAPTEALKDGTGTPKKATPRRKEDAPAASDIHETSSVESADEQPPISLRGPFADEEDTAPLPLGNLLKPQDDANPLLFPGPLLSSDDEDVVHFDESQTEAFPETTFVPPTCLDAKLHSSAGDINSRASRLKAANKSASSSSSKKAFLSNVFDPSAATAPPSDINESLHSMDGIFDKTKRSAFQNTPDNSHRDILFDGSSGSIDFDPNDAPSKKNGNELGCDGAVDERVVIHSPSKINSSVVADGQVDRKFWFKGGDLDDDGCVRVKLCPAQIGYLLDGKAHVHPGYYSGPLNSQCRMHGNGMFWFASGDTYLGQFRNGELHGAGMMSVTDDETGNKQVFSGYFSHNKYVGDEMVDDGSA